MKSIEIRSQHCVSCGRCLRKCDVKAIRLTEEGAIIDDELCLHCGRCMKACPHGAIFYLTEVRKVLNWLKYGQDVVVSLSTELGYSYPDLTVRHLVGALKKAGVKAVHEAAEASAVQNDLLAERANRMLMGSYNMSKESLHQSNIIIADCPAVVNRIEIYYPELIPQLASMAPIGIAHGRYLKKKYGKDTKVVYISSCYAMRNEYGKPANAGALDAVLTARDLKNLFSYMDIDMSSCIPAPFDSAIMGVDRLYPIRGGLIQALEANEKYPKAGFYSLSADGISSVNQVLEDLKKGVYSKCMIELHNCTNGCVNGPGKASVSSASRTAIRLKQNTASTRSGESAINDLRQSMDFKTSFTSRKPDLPIPDQEDLNRIIAQMGMTDMKEEMDCGACGFPYCYKHAEAIFQGRSTVNRCIQYLHNKADSLANVVLDNSPNMVFILDHDLVIRECSSICERYFNQPKEAIIGSEIIEFMDDTDFEWAIANKQHLKYKMVELVGYNRFVQQNITYLFDSDSLLVILIDVTEQIKKEEQQIEKNKEIVELTQNIVDKQMMVAQTIAGLLGESTAETKLALIRLSQSLLDGKAGER